MSDPFSAPPSPYFSPIWNPLDPVEQLPQISAVSSTYEPKLPEFDISDPEYWFETVLCVFEARNIKSQRTMFSIIIPYLSPIRNEIRDVVLNQEIRNDPDCFSKLRKIIMDRVGPSIKAKVNKLLNEANFGTTKPSSVIRKMKALAGDKVDEIVLKELFLKRLPNDYRMALTSCEDTHLDELGAKADNLWEYKNSQTWSTNMALATTPQPSNPDSMYKDLVKALVAALTIRDQRPPYKTRRQQPRSRHRSYSRSRSRPTSPNPASNICWYHSVYKAKARKCSGRCDFNKEGTSEN